MEIKVKANNKMAVPTMDIIMRGMTRGKIEALMTSLREHDSIISREILDALDFQLVKETGETYK